MLKRLSLLLLCLLCSLLVYGQKMAKKPRIMIVPSDALMLKLGLLESVENDGDYNFYQHYKRAFLNDELKATIAKFGELMRDRGFPMTDMEQMLKNAQNNPNYVIPSDINVELNYWTELQGPRKILYTEFKGIDICSGKQIAAASGNSAPAIGATQVDLLQEAVIDKLEKFCGQFMRTFEDMAVKGREATLIVRDEQGRLEDKNVNEVIDSWLGENCVNGSFNIDNSDESVCQVSQAMMPLFNNSGNALDARRFLKPLQQKLKDMGFTVKVRNIKGSIGQVEFILE